jgi:NADH-quinone oxidoreductase subunit N
MPHGEFPDVIPAVPEIFAVAAAMGLLILGVFQKESSPAAGVAAARLVGRLSLVVLALTLVLALALGARGPTRDFGDMFVVDEFALYLKALILAAAALTLVMAKDFLERHRMARFEYPVLILFATVGMMMMVSANDLMSLYMGLELQSLSLYVIATFHRDDVRSSEAGLKYFVLGALASGMLLYGASLVYGYSGTTGFVPLAETFSRLHGGSPSPGLVVGLVFILAGLAFKISAVPFHMWTPDVYEGAPTPVTAFFSVAPKLAAFGLLVRVLTGPFADLLPQWQQIVVIVSLASMVLGGFAAIGQTNIKRLMAYSSIGHVGYALIGLAAGSQSGVRSVLIYLTIYVVMNIGVFCCILCMHRHERMVEGIGDLAGLGRTHPALALALTVFMFSMAGIPPLAGFFGKLYIFLAAVEAGLYTLAVVGVLTSVVAAYYYIRIVRLMYFEEVAEPLDRHVNREVGIILAGACLLVGLFILYPDPLLSSAGSAAAALFGG